MSDKNLDEPKKRNAIFVSLQSEDYAKLLKFCRKNYTKMSTYVRSLILKEFDRQEEKELSEKGNES